MSIQSLKASCGDMTLQNRDLKLKTGIKDRCYNFSVNIIKFVGTLPEQRTYRIISDQLLRSATSIGANIFEAKYASSKKDFINYYQIALKSSNETEYWLGLLRDALNLKYPDINALSREAEELSKIIAASLLTTKDRR